MIMNWPESFAIVGGLITVLLFILGIIKILKPVKDPEIQDKLNKLEISSNTKYDQMHIAIALERDRINGLAASAGTHLAISEAMDKRLTTMEKYFDDSYSNIRKQLEKMTEHYERIQAQQQEILKLFTSSRRKED